MTVDEVLQESARLYDRIVEENKQREQEAARLASQSRSRARRH